MSKVDINDILRSASLLFIDEVPMLPKDFLRCINKLREKSDMPFGDKVYILGGDF